MRSLVVFAVYAAIPISLVWRAETYVDQQGHALLLERIMCILLAVFLALTGLVQGLDRTGSGAR